METVSSVASLLAEAAETRPADLYCVGHGGRVEFGELHRRAMAVAASLRAAGVGPGDRVAMSLPNHPDHVSAILALTQLDAVWVALNPKLRGESLRHQLRDSRPTFLVAPASEMASFQAAVERPLPALAWTESGFEAAFDERPSEPVGRSGTPVAAALDRVAVLMYTSGTTGAPKAVEVTERMWLAAADAALVVSGAEDGDRLLLWEPLCHIGGAQVLLLPFLRRLTLALTDGFHATGFWREARRLDVTHIHHLGGILQILAGRPGTADDRDHRVRVTWGGGCDAATWVAVQQRFGLEVRECYGMTEVSSIVTMNRLGPDHGVGRPLPAFDIEVVDEVGGRVREGEVGEITVGDRGAGLLTPGYFGRPEATAAARRDGRWWTGDRGRWDSDGCLIFLGRAGDSIRRRGENVSASHVELVVAAHPAVAEAAVVGVDSDVADQEILLYVVPAIPGQSPAPEDLVDWCRTRLAEYEVPRYLKFVDALPKTPSERIAKGLLPRTPQGALDLQPRREPS